MMPLLKTSSEGSGPTPTSTISPAPTMTFTPTSSPTLAPGEVRVVAAPNVSRDNSPIQFRINLGRAASLHLSLFTLTGEEVNQMDASGLAGSNTLAWALDNRNHSSVASGLYVYLLRVDDGNSVTSQTGKVVILH